MTEGAVTECEQLGAQDLDMTIGDHQNEDLDMTNAVHQNRASEAKEPSVEREAEVSNGLDGSSIANHIPSRLLNTSAEQRGRCPYKAAGRLGLKVARGRSKSPDVTEVGKSVSASTGHGAETSSTLP